MRRVVILLVLAALLPAVRAATAAVKRHYQLAGGDAATTLRQFVEQSGEQVIYVVPKVRGVKTHSVQGEFTAREVLDRMLANTALIVVKDEKTGALLINRAAPAPPPAAPTAPAAPAPPPTSPPPKSPSSMKTSSLFTRIAATFTLMLAPAAGAAESSSSSEKPGELVQLSPFEVTSDKDYGYTAANTLAGGRLATEIKDTPGSISVLTREFLDDIGAQDFSSAMLYATNSIPMGETDTNTDAIGTALSSAPGNQVDQATVTIRGIAKARVTRDYFVWNLNSDGYNTERIDISRGPNTLVFGDAGSGGVANVATKQARFDRRFATLGVTTSSFGGGRLTVDVNQPLGDRFAVRASAVTAREDGWRDNQRFDRDGAFLSATWKPLPRTQVRVSGEWGHVVNYAPATTFRDYISGWDGRTVVSAPLTANPAAAAGANRFVSLPQRTSATEYLVMINGHEELGFRNWANFARTNGSTASLETRLAPAAPAGAVPLVLSGAAAGSAANGTRYIGVLPYRAFTASARDRSFETDQTAVTATINHQVGGALFLEAGFAHQEDSRRETARGNTEIFLDINQVRPSATGGVEPNPFFLQPFVFSTSDGDQYRVIENSYDEIRVSAVYRLKTPYLEQNIGLFASSRWTENHLRVLRLKRLNNGTVNGAAANSLIFHTYLADRGAPNAMDQASRLGSVGGILTGFVETNGGGGGGFINEATSDTLQFFSSGSWFKGRRLKTLVGVRRDVSKPKRWNPSFDAATGFRRPDYNFGGGRTLPRTSTTAGAVYDILPGLGIYANYSESFEATSGGNVKIDGSITDPRIGNGRDVGVKFTLWEERVSGAFSYYWQTEENSIITVLTNNNSQLAGASSVPIGLRINEIYTALGLPVRFAANYNDLQSLDADGVEVDLTANITRNWSVLANIAFPKVNARDSLRESRAFIEANRAGWLASASASGPAAVAAVNTSLGFIDGIFQQFPDSRQTNGKVDFTGNLFTRYRFSTGAFKGLRIGGGLNLRGRRVAGTDPLGNTLYSSGFPLLNALVGYDTKLKKYPLRFQMNITNLLDEAYQRYATYFTVAGALQPFAYTQQAPRKIQFSASIGF